MNRRKHFIRTPTDTLKFYTEQIRILREKGMSTVEIGRILKRDHTTIVYWLQKMKMPGGRLRKVVFSEYKPAQKPYIKSSRFPSEPGYQTMLMRYRLREKERCCPHNAFATDGRCYWCGKVRETAQYNAI